MGTGVIRAGNDSARWQAGSGRGLDPRHEVRAEFAFDDTRNDKRTDGRIKRRRGIGDLMGTELRSAFTALAPHGRRCQADLGAGIDHPIRIKSHERGLATLTQKLTHYVGEKAGDAFRGQRPVMDSAQPTDLIEKYFQAVANGDVASDQERSLVNDRRCCDAIDNKRAGANADFVSPRMKIKMHSRPFRFGPPWPEMVPSLAGDSTRCGIGNAIDLFGSCSDMFGWCKTHVEGLIWRSLSSSVT